MYANNGVTIRNNLFWMRISRVFVFHRIELTFYSFLNKILNNLETILSIRIYYLFIYLLDIKN